MKTLVIAEKPSVARDIVDALPGSFENNDTYYESDDTIVTFAVGHLVELVAPEEYDERFKKWRMDDLPIIPDQFKLDPRDTEARKQLKAIHKLLKRDDIDRVINACDAGREGELIFAYIYETSGVDKPVQRLWISSMTKQAIREGFERLRPGSQLEPLEAAARSRSEADWLVGMNATRAATIRGRAWVGGVVSLGRVQTPTLAMIVKREREIQAFVPEPYWLVRAAFQPLYEGLWFERDETRIKKAARADEIVERVSSNDGVVDSVERKEQSERAPLLYDLTAITPTDVEHDVTEFTPDERRIFDLVARRFLAVSPPPARYARTTIVTLVEGERFRTRGKVTLEAGWRAVYGLEPDAEKPQDEEGEGGELPAVEKGQSVRCVAADSEAKETKPPPRYTEATLLSAMETAGKLVDDEELREAMKERGLGTPATRAETIETLIRREYVERVDKDLQATPKGLQVITMLEAHPLTSPELTGGWEKQLADIERGSGDRGAFMKEIEGFTRATVEQIAALDREKLRPERVELGPCPRCGETIRENSRAYGCTSWKSREEPGCGFVIWKRVAGRTLTPEIARQLLEEGRTREVLSGFRSRAGKPFRARLVLNDEGKTEFEFPARTETVQPTAAE